MDDAVNYNCAASQSMTEHPGPIEIPNRALFKAAEVCELAKVQPYVLRSWEAEFLELEVTTSAGGPRVYRRADVEQVLRIKHLLLVEGLTLAGARRRLQEESTPVAADVPVIDELIGQHARERLTEVKRGLRAILQLLNNPENADFRLSPPAPTTTAPVRRSSPRPEVNARAPRMRPAPSRGPSSPPRSSPSPRRKRSA